MNDPHVPPGHSAPDAPMAVGSPHAESAPADEAAPDEPLDPDPERAPLDLERVAADLDGVESALGRLDEGTYWTDEVIGETIPDDVLAANPVARRAEANG